MAKSDNLRSARKAKNDEFYTQYADIQTEVNAYLDFNPDLFKNKTVLCPCDDPEWSNFTKFFAQNFQRFGLKKFISTSYSKTPGQFGKIFWIDRDVTGDGRIDINDLQWDILSCDGDFRSLEVTAIRDQADFIITNPPFSLFREFMDWIWKGPGLHYLLVSNKNAIAYKEVFPKIKNNLIWSGAKPWSNFEFETPELDDKGNKVKKSVPAIWLTNIDHGRRHQPLQLMTIAENLRLSKHDAIRGKTFEEAYPKYDNYEAINVDFTDAIPRDYEGVMGVPISFLDKFCPEQFEILGITNRGNEYGIKTKEFTAEDDPAFSDLNRGGAITVNGKLKSTYHRILIRKK